MAKDATKIRVATTGTVWLGDSESTVFPDDLDAPGAGWVDMGYTTEDGVTFAIGRDVEEIMGWQAVEALRVVATSEPKSVSFTLLQLEKSTLLAALGGTVSQTDVGPPAVYRWIPSAPGYLPVRPLMIDFQDGDFTYRFAFRRAQQRGAVEIPFTRSGAVTLPVEYAALAGNPQSWFIDSDDPAML